MDSSVELPNSLNQDETGGGASTAGLLRASRVRIGDELADVAKVLKIRLFYLEAIEAGEFERLPGNAYALGFIRSYSEYLGLDGEEIVRRFKIERAGVRDKPELTFPALVPENGIPGAAVIMIGLVIAAAGYGGWYFLSENDRFTTALVDPLPAQISKLAEATDKPVGLGQETPKPQSESLAANTAATSAPATETSPSTSAAAAPEPAATPTEPAPGTAPVTTESQGTDATIEPEAPDQDPDHSASPAVSTISTPATTADAAVTATQASVTPAVERMRPGAASESTPVIRPAVVTAVTETPAQTAATPSTPVQATPAEPTNSAVAPATPAPAAPAVEPAQNFAAADIMAPEPGALSPTPPPASVPAALPAPDPQQVGFDDTGPGRTPTGPILTPQSSTATNEPAQPDAASTPAAAPETPAPTSATTEVASTPGPSRIIVKAKLDSWIQVRDDRVDQLILTRLLREGDQYDVPNRPGLVLLTGNAGALEFVVDGEQVPSVGPLGAVRRHVALDADKLRSGNAVIE